MLKIKNHIKYILFSILLVLSTILAKADENENVNYYLQSETPYFESIRDGMVSKICRNIFEDNEGFIWTSTRNGIVRYDGISIQNVFRGKSNDKYEYDVKAFCEDTICNCIWAVFAQKGDILRINKKDLSCELIPFISPEDAKIDIRNNITSVFNYNDSLLLFASAKSFFFCNKNTGYIRNSNFKIKNSTNDIFETLYNVFIIENKKLYKIIDRDVDTLRVEQLDIKYEGRIRRVDSMNDSLVVFTATSELEYYLYQYNMNTDSTTLLATIERKLKARSLPNDIACSVDGIWIASSNGVLFYKYSESKLYEFNTRNSYLPENNVTCVTRCKKQPILFFGSGDGIIKLDYLSSKFNIVDLRHNSESKSCKMYMIHKDVDGGYWTWCLDGLFYKAPNDFIFRKYSIDDAFDQYSMLSMCEDTTRKVIYINGLYHLIEYNIRTHKHRYIYECSNSPYPRKLYNDGYIKSKNHCFNFPTILENGVLVCCQRNKLLFYDTNTKKYSLKEIENKQGIIALDAEGDSVVWAAMNDQTLILYNIKTQKLVEYKDVIPEKARINSLRTVYRGGQREIWVASRSHGLFYYLPSKKKSIRIEYSSYLYNEIFSLEIDKNQNIWAASSDGIICINNSNGSVSEFGRETNALCQTFNNRTSSLGWNNEVLMGGVNYYVEFNTDVFPVNKYFPTPKIVSYKFLNATTNSFDSYTNEEYFGAADTIQIPKGIRSIQLNVRMLNYNNSANNTIEWRMPENDTSWVKVKTTSPLIFSNLSRGVHKLELRSCDQNGISTSNTKVLYFNKLVYFNKNPIFYIIIIILVIIIIIMVIHIKSKIARQQRRKLEREVERQAGNIRRTNEQLLASQKIVEKQNIELKANRENLEKQVAERTRDLEIEKQKAEESSKLKSAFLANLSHEVRTPMNCIVGFAKLLGDSSCSQQEKEEFIHLIQESSSSLLVLIGDLLDVSRIESGQLRVNKREFNVFSEINDAYRILFVEKKNPNVDFLLDVDPRIAELTILSDKDRFRQIIINICYNAFKFTEKGHVQLSAMLATEKDILRMKYPETFPKPTNGNYLLVSIEDTGIGIASNKLDVIFEPFRKLNNNKTLYPGLGLGLNIVKNLIKILDGQIWVKSEVGQGTTFYFYLPFNNN